MTHPQMADYGAWKSPITTELIVAENISLSQPTLDGEDIYWLEGRPQEQGRNVIVRRTPDGVVADVNPAPFDARTRVHEYGGGAYLAAGGVVYFANFADQRLYYQTPGAAPAPLTAADARRYADLVMDRARGRLLCICEDHGDASREAVNSVAAVALDSGEVTTLVAGSDFYAAPRLSPDGRRLAWLSWNHPDMPWDGCELWVAEIDAAGGLAAAQRVAGSRQESIAQPLWSPDGVLHFISDRSNWWNLYRWQGGRVEALYPLEAEFCSPQWVFGMAGYAFCRQGILCTYRAQGRSHLALLEGAGAARPVELPYTEIYQVQAAGEAALLIAASTTAPPAVVGLDLASGAARWPWTTAISPGRSRSSFPPQAKRVRTPSSMRRATATSQRRPASGRRCWCSATADRRARQTARSTSASNTGPAGALRWWMSTTAAAAAMAAPIASG